MDKNREINFSNQFVVKKKKNHTFLFVPLSCFLFFSPQYLEAREKGKNNWSVGSVLAEIYRLTSTVSVHVSILHLWKVLNFQTQLLKLRYQQTSDGFVLKCFGMF